MSETVILKFNNCVMSATNPANTPNAVRISGTANYKISILTVPKITNTVVYNATTGEVKTETFRDYATETTINANIGVVRINNRLTLAFPALQRNNAILHGFMPARNASSLYWQAYGTLHYGWRLMPQDLGTSYWIKSDTGQRPGYEGGAIRFNTAIVYLTAAGVALNQNTVTINPEVFGQWESEEEVVLEATAAAYSEWPTTQTRPPAPIITTGKAYLRVEAVQ